MERFFADITNDLIREESFGSLKELESSIQCYMDDRNKNPRRYVWRKKGIEILKKINKARKTAGMGQYCEPI